MRNKINRIPGPINAAKVRHGQNSTRFCIGRSIAFVQHDRVLVARVVVVVRVIVFVFITIGGSGGSGHGSLQRRLVVIGCARKNSRGTSEEIPLASYSPVKIIGSSDTKVCGRQRTKTGGTEDWMLSAMNGSTSK